VSSDLVLDLDDDDPDAGTEPGPPWWRELQVPVWIVLLLMLGTAGAATAATHTWDARQTSTAGSTGSDAVAVLVNIPADNGLIGGGDGGTLRLGSALQVINTGRLPISLGAVATTSPGVALLGDGGGRSIPPGTAGRVILRGSINCRAWIQTEPIEMRLNVTDGNGVLRSLVKTLVIQGAWDDVLSAC
jgi:hypothetical protein